MTPEEEFSATEAQSAVRQEAIKELERRQQEQVEAEAEMVVAVNTSKMVIQHLRLELATMIDLVKMLSDQLRSLENRHD
jgi:hypothetical protein